MVRLNIGAGDVRLDGYTPVDRRVGKEAYPLDWPDGSVDEIRASHILEHFSHTETQSVLADWARTLKPGGKLRLAVPDFDKIVDYYRNGQGTELPIEGYLMGGHTDDNDHHQAIFNEDKARALLEGAGLKVQGRWTSEVQDCASLDVSLNLEAIKPSDNGTPAKNADPGIRVAACMSMPRLCFTDNFFAVYQALMPFRMNLRKHSGAFWGHSLTQCIEQTLKEDPSIDTILTVDYDTIFTASQLKALIELMLDHPEADAIAPIQQARTKQTPLFTVRQEEGKNRTQMDRDTFAPDIMPVATAQFALTLIRVSALEKMDKPWFQDVPDEHGSWGDGRIDDDIYFWRNMEKNGLKLYQANRIAVGHSENIIIWPDQNLEPLFQHPADYYDSAGPPEGVWT